MPFPLITMTHPRTGLVCPACHEPVSIIENTMRKILVFLCPTCGHRWTAEEPGVRKH